MTSSPVLERTFVSSFFLTRIFVQAAQVPRECRIVLTFGDTAPNTVSRRLPSQYPCKGLGFLRETYRHTWLSNYKVVGSYLFNLEWPHRTKAVREVIHFP